MNPSKCTFDVGRRTGILVPQDLNGVKSEEGENPELFFDSFVKPTLPEKKIIFQRGDYHPPSKSLLRVAHHLVRRTSIQEQDLSSVSTAQDTHSEEISSIGTVSQDSTHQEEEGIDVEGGEEIVDQPPVDFVLVEDDAVSLLDESLTGEESIHRSHEEPNEAGASTRAHETIGTLSTSKTHGGEVDNMSTPTENTGVSGVDSKQTGVNLECESIHEAVKEAGAGFSPRVDENIGIFSTPRTKQDNFEDGVDSIMPSLTGDANESGVDSEQHEDEVVETIHRRNTSSPEASEGGAGFCMMDQDEESETPPLLPKSIQKGKEERKRVTRGASKHLTPPANVDEIAGSLSPCKRKNKATVGRTSKSKKGRQSKSKKNTNPYQTIFSPKGLPLPRTFRHVPVSDLKPTPQDSTLRRSQRARVFPLKHWEGEKAVYGPNDFGENYDGVRNMSVIHGYEMANPTPYKKRLVRGVKRGYDSEEEFDISKIRKRFVVNEGNTARLWDIGSREIRKMGTYIVSYCLEDLMMCRSGVVSYFDQRSFQPLPGGRTRSNGVVALDLEVLDNTQVPSEVTDNKALSNFSIGSLILPPGAIKYPDCVGHTVRLFTIVNCQPKSIEIAYGDPDKESTEWNPKLACRFFLSQGDNIHVPAGAIYRMENHSKSQESIISWTTISLQS